MIVSLWHEQPSGGELLNHASVGVGQLIEGVPDNLSFSTPAPGGQRLELAVLLARQVDLFPDHRRCHTSPVYVAAWFAGMTLFSRWHPNPEWGAHHVTPARRTRTRTSRGAGTHADVWGPPMIAPVRRTPATAPLVYDCTGRAAGGKRECCR